MTYALMTNETRVKWDVRREYSTALSVDWIPCQLQKVGCPVVLQSLSAAFHLVMWYKPFWNGCRSDSRRMPHGLMLLPCTEQASLGFTELARGNFAPPRLTRGGGDAAVRTLRTPSAAAHPTINNLNVSIRPAGTANRGCPPPSPAYGQTLCRAPNGARSPRGDHTGALLLGAGRAGALCSHSGWDPAAALTARARCG